MPVGILEGLDSSAWLLLLALRLVPCSHFLRKMPARAATVSDNDLRFPELHVTCGEELSVRSKVSALCTRECVVCTVRVSVCSCSHLSSREQGERRPDWSRNCCGIGWEGGDFESEVQLGV